MKVSPGVRREIGLPYCPLPCGNRPASSVRDGAGTGGIARKKQEVGFGQVFIKSWGGVRNERTATGRRLPGKTLKDTAACSATERIVGEIIYSGAEKKFKPVYSDV